MQHKLLSRICWERDTFKLKAHSKAGHECHIGGLARAWHDLGGVELSVAHVEHPLQVHSIHSGRPYVDTRSGTAYQGPH